MDPTRRREIRQARRERRARGGRDADPEQMADPHQNGHADHADGYGYRGEAASPASAGTAPPQPTTTPQAQTDPNQQAVAMGPRAAGGPRGAASSSGSARRSGPVGGGDGASRLAEKMQRRREAESKRRQVLSEREELIQSRYAPHVMDMFQEQHQQGQSPQRLWTAAALREMTDFDKDDLLAELITRSRANFLRLDKELSDDHALATQRLHTSVFTHANDFLLLFRDVEKSSGLVEALKANVQGTKAAISSISKFTYSNVGSSARGTGYSGASSPGVFGAGGGSSAAMSRTRPSLVTRRARFGGGDGVDTTLFHPEGRAAAAAAGTHGSGSGPRDRNSSSDVGASAAASFLSVTGATTHRLNVPSIARWRYTVGRDTASLDDDDGCGDTAAASAGSKTSTGGRSQQQQGPLSGGGGTAAARGKELNEIQMFADIVKEETEQLLAERKPLDAAELLRGVSAEAVNRGCLPLLLDLETSLVQAVLRSLSYIPVTPVYVETMHVPLAQLLMSFGRMKTGSVAYLHLQTLWLQGELRKLQSRVNPAQASLVTVDFLVTAMRDILKRQHTLGMSLEDARRVLAAEEKGGAGAAAAAVAAAATTTTSPSPASAAAKARKLTRTRDGATTSVSAGGTEGTERAGSGAITAAERLALVPPNSAALLWVRDNVEFFAREVLATHMLSYGTGTDGGDPSRIRRAVSMLAETIRVLGVMTSDGFAGCDTLILRQLTPSLVVLQSEFTTLTETRMENSGRTMLEQLITNTLRMYESGGRSYTPSACGDVARKSNLRSQELLKSLKACLPCCSHSWLVQLLLCPAASTMFERGSARFLLASQQQQQYGVASKESRRAGGLAASSPSPAAATEAPLLQLEHYRYLRYANGCTSVHDVLIQSLVRFTTAMVGREWRHGSSGGGGGGSGAGGTTTNEKKGGGGGGSAASSISKATTSAGVAVAKAKESKENTEELVESSRFLLSNALLTESYDVTMTRLLRSFLATGLRERQALVNYLCSEAYTKKQRRMFPPPPAEAPRPALLADPSRSPGWVLDSMSGLLCDVISVGVWSSYFSEGAAVSHLIEVAGLVYRPRHVEQLRRAMPRVTQGWLAATLILAYHTGLAKGLLRSGSAASSSSPGPASPLLLSRQLQPQASVNMAGSPLLDGAGGGRRQVLASNSHHHDGSPASSSTARQQSSFLDSVSKRAGAAVGGRGGGLANTVVARRAEDVGEGCGAVAAVAEGGLVSVPVQLRSVPAAAAPVARPQQEPDALAMLPEADVEEDRLLPLLMALLDRKFTRGKGYTCHTMLVAAGCCVAPRGLASGEAFASANPATPLTWSVRAVVPTYPEFPIGGDFDRSDELFLFHWCAQISLQLVALFQERLLTPSFVLNAKAAEMNSLANSNSTGASPLSAAAAPTTTASSSSSVGGSSRSARAVPAAVLGCVSPAEDSVLASLCAGGGNYVAAVGLLQFLVVRLLRDALCRPATWCALYDCKNTEEWLRDERCLRQQLFFLSLFVRLWSPLFSGGMAVPVTAADAAGESAADQRRRAAGGGAPEPPSAAAAQGRVSATNVDGLPSLAVLEWLSTGGILRPRVAATSTTTAAAGQPLPPGGRAATAIDTFFGGASAADAAGSGGETDAAAAATSTGARKGWKSDGSGGGGGGLPGSKVAARQVLVGGGGGSYVPDTLLRVVQKFFEEELGETRAVAAITSDVMRKRVDRALTSINLLDFVGTSLDGDDDEEEDEEEEDDASSSGASSAGASAKRKVTLHHVRELLVLYTQPFH